MGGLQQTTVNCGEQNIKIEKSPLSTPARVSRAKERAVMQGLRVTAFRGTRTNLRRDRFFEKAISKP